MNEMVLDESIYPLEIIKKAIEDYSKIVRVDLSSSQDTNKVFLQFGDSDIEFTKIKDEFCNYLIRLIAVTKGE